jgi:hypothetical protein
MDLDLKPSAAFVSPARKKRLFVVWKSLTIFSYRQQRGYLFQDRRRPCSWEDQVEDHSVV